MYGSGRSACRSAMAAALASLSTRLPSAARPPARCSRAKASTSAALETISPAGPTERIRPQTGATCCCPSSSTWPDGRRVEQGLLGQRDGVLPGRAA